MAGIPWRAWLHAAMRMGVPPQDFWRLSVVEWLSLLGLENAGSLSRDALTRLMAAHPDRKEEHGSNG